MEQQIITENTVELEVQAVDQPLVSITESITSEAIHLDSTVDVKVVSEESAVLLVLTEGGSLYKYAVANGYSGTELEWMTELLDSKASVEFVVTTIANEQVAYAAALLALKTEVGDTYASNTHLSEVLAQRDLARAIDYQNLEAKINTDVQASYTSLIDVLATNNLAYTQAINTLTADLGLSESRIDNVEIAIVTEGQARAAAISNLSSTLNNRITAEIGTVQETIVTNEQATATRFVNLSTSFNNRFDAELIVINTAISTETNARASQIETLRVDFTSGLEAVLTEVNEVRIDISGNTSAISSLSGMVNNPTTGLVASFNRANQAYTLADNTAGSLAIIEGKVNNPITGLAATYTFVQQVEINASTNTATAINNLRNEITAPNAAWTANNTFIQSIDSKAGNALTNAANAQNKADTAFTNAGNAQTAANNANAELLAIASDAVLSKGEKPAVILNVTNILNEQAGITAEGVRYGISTQRTNYTNSINTLNTYLSGLSPSYSDTTQNTPIVAATFRQRFADVYSTRQILLDAIAAAAKVLADNAKTAADNAQGTANNAITIVTDLSNNLENTVSGYIAGNSLILEIQDDLEGNILATSTLSSTVTSLDGWKTNVASVQLQTHTNQLGTLESRAFIGVSATAGGKAVVAGLTVNSINYSLSFQGDIFELVNTSGVQQLYYDTAQAQWNFAGSLVAASFKTATSGYRVEMDGTSNFPIWYGQGTKNSSNGLFYTDKSGNVVMQNATMYNASIQGSLVTDSGTGIRTEIVDDGTYLIWIGSGAKTDSNAIFWIKRNQTGFISGEFFQGEIIETKFATYSSTANEAALATIYNHNSAGKTMEITGSGNVRARATGGDYSNLIFEASGTLYRSGFIVATVVAQVRGVYNVDLNRTEWFLNYPCTGISTGHGVGNQTAQYQVTFSLVSGSTPNFTYISKTATVKTFENKLE